MVQAMFKEISLFFYNLYKTLTDFACYFKQKNLILWHGYHITSWTILEQGGESKKEAGK